MNRFSLAGKTALRDRRQPRHRPRHCHRPGRGRRRCGAQLSQRAGDEAETCVARNREAWPPRHRRADGCDRSRQRGSRRQRRARLRPRLDPRQQCRHQQADRFRSGHRCGLGCDPGHQSQGPLHLRAGLPAAAERGRRRLDRSYRLGQRPIWRPAHGALCRLQGRTDFAGPGHRPLRRARQYPLQYRGRRPDRLGDGGGRHGGGQRAEGGRNHRAEAHGHPARSGRRRRVPGQRCVRPTSPRKPSM